VDCRILQPYDIHYANIAADADHANMVKFDAPTDEGTGMSSVTMSYITPPEVRAQGKISRL
jgi:hypothetical protein